MPAAAAVESDIDMVHMWLVAYVVVVLYNTASTSPVDCESSIDEQKGRVRLVGVGSALSTKGRRRGRGRGRGRGRINLTGSTASMHSRKSDTLPLAVQLRARHAMYQNTSAASHAWPVLVHPHASRPSLPPSLSRHNTAHSTMSYP